MAKRCALYFGMAGYLLVIWHDAFRFDPLKSSFALNWLHHACFVCVEGTLGVQSVRGTLLIGGPINALLYAILGYLLGKAIVTIRTSWTH
jgi:hypothetical protein